MTLPRPARNDGRHVVKVAFVLRRAGLNAAPESSPVTFAANGGQYVAVVAGSGSPFGAGSRLFVPEALAATAGVTLVVFELPQD
jgi:hypothetical protein